MQSSEHICQRLLRGIGIQESFQLEQIRSGYNNRVFLVTQQNQKFILKIFFSDKKDLHDRFAAETRFLKFCEEIGLNVAPKLLAQNSDDRASLMSFLDGRKISHEEVSLWHIERCAHFIHALNVKKQIDSQRLPRAADSSFSLQGHLELVNHRLEHLLALVPSDELDCEFNVFLKSELVPAWQHLLAIRTKKQGAIGDKLSTHSQCVSPSDFGFHNILFSQTMPEPKLYFLDFEYAGTDDPAKLICDFFSQLQVPVDLKYWRAFIDTAFAGHPELSLICERARFLLPYTRIKWICIALNIFANLPARRRFFAEGSTLDFDSQRRSKIALGKKLLPLIDPDLGE